MEECRVLKVGQGGVVKGKEPLVGRGCYDSSGRLMPYVKTRGGREHRPAHINAAITDDASPGIFVVQGKLAVHPSILAVHQIIQST